MLRCWSVHYCWQTPWFETKITITVSFQGHFHLQFLEWSSQGPSFVQILKCLCFAFQLLNTTHRVQSKICWYESLWKQGHGKHIKVMEKVMESHGIATVQKSTNPVKCFVWHYLVKHMEEPAFHYASGLPLFLFRIKRVMISSNV